MTYNVAGQITGDKLGNLTTEVFGYDTNRMQLTVVQDSDGGTPMVYSGRRENADGVRDGYLHALAEPYVEGSEEWPLAGEQPTSYSFQPIPGSCKFYDQAFSRTVDLTNSSRITYKGKSMNSNSFVYTALKRAGLTISVSDIPVRWYHQAWGWGNLLPIGF